MSVPVVCPCGNQPCGISRGDRTWVEHVPHEGWVYHGCFVDTRGLNANCDMCDKDIRYVHEITHEASGLQIGVGCVCAKNLCRHSLDPSMKVPKVDQAQKEAKRKARIPTKDGLRTKIEQLKWKNCSFRSKSGNAYVGQESSFRADRLRVLVSVYRGKSYKGSWYWSACFFHDTDPPRRKNSSRSFRHPRLAWGQLKASLYKLFHL